MMRSMYAAVSGLSVHQTKMDVIGNNIANVNTVGFKGSNVTFQEVFSQTIKGAGSPTDGRGGTNPQQIGLGAGVSSISVNHKKGSTQRTDNPTDLMIDGSGFFVVTNDANAQNKFYTRAGNFTVDRNGNLVTAEGYKVLDTDFNPVQINKSETKKATMTEQILLQGNINSSDGDYTTTVDIYDSLGDVHTMSINFHGDAIPVEYTPNTIDGGLNGNVSDLDPKYNPTYGALPQDYMLKEVSVQDSDGDYYVGNSDGTTVGDGDLSTTDGNEIYALFNEEGQVVDLVTFGGDATLAEGSLESLTTNNPLGQSTIDIDVAGADDITIGFDRSIFFQNGDTTKTRTFTQYSQETDAKTVAFDGNSAGSINSFNISSKGEVVGVFTNGERQTLGTITLADFDNPAGLEKVGSNMFINTNNSGTPKYGQPSTGSFGALNPGALEMSNVDLSKEFTEMITTQRGFQANSRVISTSDEILQELVNLKR